jgi:hypothetical protein
MFFARYTALIPDSSESSRVGLWNAKEILLRLRTLTRERLLMNVQRREESGPKERRINALPELETVWKKTNKPKETASRKVGLGHAEKNLLRSLHAFSLHPSTTITEIWY